MFGFISSETQTMIVAHLKQMIVNLDAIERKFYEQKITDLDEAIKQAHAAGDQVTMQQIMAKVGLDPTLKETIDHKSIIAFLDAQRGAKPFEPQSLRSITERKIKEARPS